MERDTDIPPSVNVFLPPEIDRQIHQLAEADGTSWTMVIHGALWAFRGEHMTEEERRQELVELIQAGLDSSPGIEATPEFWEDFKRRVEERLERIQQAKTGNLLLPVELYTFINDQIASGAYRNPTEVVCAAMPSLRRWLAARGAE
jgi:Arc/MetJ-type ribon-helix-helix transcriptional regulator